MPHQTTSNKTIARNTIMLYFRMIIAMVVGLYTSRVILATLGVDDYGTYSVVGGIVTMMGFLNVSMSGATSRFITYELGRGNFQRLRDIFSTAVVIHFIIAVVIILVSETVGLWFLCNKLVIPEGRMFAAHIVFQLSVATAAVNIIQTPYTAAIMSHEKMDIYACFELLNVFLKLGIVYLLMIADFDKLITYAVLMFSVTLIIQTLYRVYCKRHFTEAHFYWIWNPELIKPMLSFSGWDLYGNMGARVYQQGLSFIQNMLFGVALNAAHGIASTVQGIVMGLSGNVMAAFRPAIIKEYAAEHYETAVNQFVMSVKMTLFLYLVAITPVIEELSYIMHLWLEKVPDYAVDICKLLLYLGLINQLQMTLNIIIHATGKVRALSFMAGTMFMLSIVFAYFIYKYTNDPLSAYYFFFLIHILIIVFDFIIIKKQAPRMNIVPIVRRLLPPTLAIIVLGSWVLHIPAMYMQESMLRILCVCVISVIFYTPCVYYLILNGSERASVAKIIKTKVYDRFWVN